MGSPGYMRRRYEIRSTERCEEESRLLLRCSPRLSQQFVLLEAFLLDFPNLRRFPVNPLHPIHLVSILPSILPSFLPSHPSFPMPCARTRTAAVPQPLPYLPKVR